MRLLTARNLTILMVAMPVAMVALAAVCVGRYLGESLGFELPATIASLFIVVGGMWTGAGIVWSSSHGTKDETAFALATPAEKTVWLGGAVVALAVVGVALYYDFVAHARWVSAFEPLMMCALTIPALAQISVGRRLIGRIR